ncbi:MAG: inosine/guanosine kinase [Deltaproteobacteria bacterium]|nr:inosine/guanosine kinase [Deltaproteobacteria bacterium]
MRFPGDRLAKHYFPVPKKTTRLGDVRQKAGARWWLVGLDHILLDMEVTGECDFLEEFGLQIGESVVLGDGRFKDLVARLKSQNLPVTYAAGGTVANTLNNYTYLSNEPARLLGAIQKNIQVGQPAFHYVSQTPPAVDMNHLVAVDGSIGTAITFISADGERSFAVAPGVSNDCPAEAIRPDDIESATVVLTTQYCLRDPEQPIAAAAERMMSLAKQARIPVAFGLGTAGLVKATRQQVIKTLSQYVTVAAMNVQEAEALTEQADALLACQTILDWVDLVIITEGARGMTIGGYVDEKYKRETDQKIRSKSIAEYNRWEYSRLMRLSDCQDPIKVYSHIHPYHGGPDHLSNTSGAGDAALAAILHDIAANRYHRANVPESEKHIAGVPFLTYSSLSRNTQYGNRVAYEVLKGCSPRLDSRVGSDKG